MTDRSQPTDQGAGMIRVRMVPASPFARKCRVAAAHLGLDDRVIFVDGDDDPGNELRSRNPLNKIPIALLDDGTTLFDSRVILEYFDHLAGGDAIIPVDPARRFRALTWQALADGVLDAAILIGYEARYREAHERSPNWLTMQNGKIARALDAAERRDMPEAIDVGSIALACALGFLDLRHGGAWRDHHPRLVAFLDGFARRVPAFDATRAAR
jgi:glutathione S-transferase